MVMNHKKLDIMSKFTSLPAIRSDSSYDITILHSTYFEVFLLFDLIKYSSDLVISGK